MHRARTPAAGVWKRKKEQGTEKRGTVGRGNDPAITVKRLEERLEANGTLGGRRKSTECSQGSILLGEGTRGGGFEKGVGRKKKMVSKWLGGPPVFGAGSRKIEERRNS